VTTAPTPASAARERWGITPVGTSPWAPAAGPVRIAPMRRRDLRAVLRIDAQQAPQGWSVGLYLAELRRARPAGGEPAGSDRSYLVARDEGGVVGFAGVLLQPPDAHVTTIAVHEAARGRRVGTRLMLVVARQAAAAGADNLTLEVRAGNVPAISLYRRFGLVPVGVRPGYYADIGEDALVMWAHDLRTGGYAARLADIEARLQEPTMIDGLDPPSQLDQERET
jgi:[ribosomal protein S18]-alanine N-acetyltransferase